MKDLDASELLAFSNLLESASAFGLSVCLAANSWSNYRKYS